MNVAKYFACMLGSTLKTIGETLYVSNHVKISELIFSLFHCSSSSCLYSLDNTHEDESLLPLRSGAVISSLDVSKTTTGTHSSNNKRSLHYLLYGDRIS